MKAKSKSMKNQPKKPIALSPSQLQSRQQQLLVVDVRGWLEYWMGHVPGAKRLNQGRILKEVPKDQAIAITCLSGYRSEVAAHWLIAQGYRQVYNLQGGLIAWQGAGYTVQRGNRP